MLCLGLSGERERERWNECVSERKSGMCETFVPEESALSNHIWRSWGLAPFADFALWEGRSRRVLCSLRLLAAPAEPEKPELLQSEGHHQPTATQ